MSWAGFEPTIPASKRAKTVNALDRAATVTGRVDMLVINNFWREELVKKGKVLSRIRFKETSTKEYVMNGPKSNWELLAYG
jgi:hypothetical protein